jgi:hypothetical protein
VSPLAPGPPPTLVTQMPVEPNELEQVHNLALPKSAEVLPGATEGINDIKVLSLGFPDLRWCLWQNVCSGTKGLSRRSLQGLMTHLPLFRLRPTPSLPTPPPKDLQVGPISRGSPQAHREARKHSFCCGHFPPVLLPNFGEPQTSVPKAAQGLWNLTFI